MPPKLLVEECSPASSYFTWHSRVLVHLNHLCKNWKHTSKTWHLIKFSP